MINWLRIIMGKFSYREKIGETWENGRSAEGIVDVKRDKDGRAICPDCGEVIENAECLVEEEITDKEEAIVITTNKKNIGRNDPCPCGSGKKYKKCCLGTDREDFESTKNIVECNICNKAFDKRDFGSFQSIEQEGKSINFCPECNINLWCSSCLKKLGKKSFDLYSCGDCGAIFVTCIDCSKRNKQLPSHPHAVGYIKQ